MLKHTKWRKVLPKPRGPIAGADLRFFSPQPDTSLHCDHVMCWLLPIFRRYSVHVPTDWVDLGGWLHAEVYPLASQY